MTIQIITSENGDELVVLSRREYDALLARAGDEEAEDRVLGAAAREVFDRLDIGTEGVVDISDRVRDHRPSPANPGA